MANSIFIFDPNENSPDEMVDKVKSNEKFKKFTLEEIKAVGDRIGVNWDKISLDQLVAGTQIELEHTDVTEGKLEPTVRIALAHLEELPDYYTRLKEMETKGEAEMDKDAASSTVKPREKGKKFLNKEEAMKVVKDLTKSFTSIKKQAISSKRNNYSVRVNPPNPTMAQSNTGETIDRLNTINQELMNMYSGLREIEALAINQGLLTEEELKQIVMPLRDSVESLLEATRSEDDFRQYSEQSADGEESEETEVEEPEVGEASENEQVVEDSESAEIPGANKDKNKGKVEVEDEEQSSTVDEKEKERVKRPQPGPRRKTGGSVERDLEYPATNFADDKVTANGDIQKQFRVIGGSGEGRGWKGDPEGHAEAARERWQMEGVPPGGRKEPPKSRRGATTPTEERDPVLIPKPVREFAVKAAGRAGRGLARSAGDAVAELGIQAFGTVAGLVLFRYLGGQSVAMGELLAAGTTGLKEALRRSFELKRIDYLTRKIKLAQVAKQWATKI